MTQLRFICDHCTGQSTHVPGCPEIEREHAEEVRSWQREVERLRRELAEIGKMQECTGAVWEAICKATRQTGDPANARQQPTETGPSAPAVRATRAIERYACKNYNSQWHPQERTDIAEIIERETGIGEAEIVIRALAAAAELNDWQSKDEEEPERIALEKARAFLTR